jgi:TolA protein
VTPKATPKPSPKTSPKHTPAKPKASTSPKPKASAKPKTSLKASPTASSKSENADQSDEDHPHKSSAEKSNAGAKKSSSDTKKASTAKGDGKGNSDAKNAFLASKGGGTGAGGAGGNGADAGTVDAYQTLIHDRFFSQWEQPTSIPTEHKHDFSTTLKITIQRDGTISDFGLAKPSGNPVMDQSVLEAARKVIKIAPVPEGMGGAGGYTININFELE